jgi:hypothetical protein
MQRSPDHVVGSAGGATLTVAVTLRPRPEGGKLCVDGSTLPPGQLEVEFMYCWESSDWASGGRAKDLDGFAHGEAVLGWLGFAWAEGWGIERLHTLVDLAAEWHLNLSATPAKPLPHDLLRAILVEWFGVDGDRCGGRGWITESPRASSEAAVPPADNKLPCPDCGGHDDPGWFTMPAAAPACRSHSSAR